MILQRCSLSWKQAALLNCTNTVIFSSPKFMQKPINPQVFP